MSEPSKRWHRVGQAVVAASLLASLGLTATPTQAAAPVRVVGCSEKSLNMEKLNLAGGVKVVAPELEEADAPDGPDGADDEQPDGADATDQNQDEQQPKIAGSIATPAGVAEDDEAALAPLAKVDKQSAGDAALAVLADPSKRRVKTAELQDENGFVVWGIETAYVKGASGPDKNLEVKVDAGNGAVLSIECD